MKKDMLEAELVTLQEVPIKSNKAHFENRCLAIEISHRVKSVPYTADLIQTR